MRRGLALAAAALLLAGCGGDDDADRKLDRSDAERLAYARERLDDAIDTAEVLRTDRTEARRLRRAVAASDLPNVAPSLIEATLDGKDRAQRIRTLGRQTVAAYLREAERDTEPIWPDLARRLSAL